jgi:hypothetical protein
MIQDDCDEKASEVRVTDDNPEADPEKAAETFAAQAAEQQPGLLAEFLDFLRYNKKWWLTPIILVLLLVGTLVVLSGTAVAPFIYTLW